MFLFYCSIFILKEFYFVKVITLEHKPSSKANYYYQRFYS